MASGTDPIGRDVEALAFDPNSGTLFGIQPFSVQGPQLVTIDTSNGFSTSVGSLSFAGIKSLAFDPIGGSLFATTYFTDQLLSIDPLTGAATAIGPLGFDSEITGLTFVPDVTKQVPEPGVLSLFGLGLVMLYAGAATRRSRTADTGHRARATGV